MTPARGSILFAVLAAMLWIALPVSQAANLPSTGLMGVVKSADGSPMEGVAVSARLSGQSYTTSVFTDDQGEYYFPPLADGQYRIWAQAVGYDMGRGELNLSSGKKIEQNFTLQPRKDFYKQLSASEWAESLPGDTPQDQRMKDLVHYNCTLCHLTGFIMAKRFDASGWSTILDTMINRRARPNSATHRLLTSYKDELVQYLARVRGPDPNAMHYKAFPRTTGEANQIVVTEYEIPRGDTGTYTITPDGSDWAQGIASGFGRISGGDLHDAVAAKDGNVYFSDNTFPGRTIGRLDPRTGRVTSFVLDDGKGIASRTHGAIPDRDGNVWFNNGSDGTIIKFDPATESFTRYPKAPGGLKTAGHIEVDSKGNIFTSAPNTGVVKLDPKTGKYTDYEALTAGGNPYGIAVDSEDNAWMAQLAADRLMVVNGRNGEVGEVILPRLPGVSQKDIEIGERDGAAGNAAPLYFKGPRRLGGDPKGDSVWVAEFWAGKLAKINIHTREIKEFSLPSKYSHPYDVQVDKNHMVWVNLMNSDRVAKFNPYTEKFTEYPLPSRGTETRHISIDDSTTPPTVWLAESGIAKIARVQFRTDTAGETKVAEAAK